MEQLEDSIVQNKLIEVELERIDEQESGVNKAMRSLAEEGLPTDIDTLRKIIISEDAFAQWIRKAQDSFIGKLGFVPREELKRIRNSFRALTDRTATARNSIANFLNGAKYPIIQEKDGTLHYDRAEAVKALTAQFTKRFTEEDKEYFRVLQEAKAALVKLSDWEQEHQYSRLSYSTDNIGKFLVKEFTKEWFQNNMGVRIGKMNPQAIRMLEEQSDEDED